jgi:hypothetical protein
MSEVAVSLSLTLKISKLVRDEYDQEPIVDNDLILEIKNSITNTLSSYLNYQSIINITVEKI